MEGRARERKLQVSIPAVILPAGWGHGSTCIARSLGRIGVPVYSVDCTSRTLVSFSRYCRGGFAWDDKLPAEQSVEFLLRVGQRIGQRSILIATTDETATLVADNAYALREWFIFPSVGSNLVHSLYSKKGMYQLARQLGMPTPQAVFPTSRCQVLEFLESAVFPVVIKGIDGDQLARRAGKKGFIAHTRSELLKKYDSIEDPDNPNLMFQEYIPGGDETVWGLEGYFNESSECVFAITGRKLRQWPPYQGVTTLGVCLKNETVDEITREFVKAVGYRGILDIGYRFDSRDGLYKLLDVNPRIGCTFRLFVAENGMDVARAIYLDLTGQPISPADAREGRKWIVEDLDMLSSPRYVLDRRLTVKEWIRSFRGIAEAAFFSLDDPLPFLAMCLNRAFKLLRSTCRKRILGEAGESRCTYSPNRWA